MTRRSYSGNAPATTLSGGINNSVLSLSVASATGYPAGGGSGPFVIVIDRGLATEEKLLIDSKTGTTFTVNAAGRGWDGTTAASHSAGAVVEHVLSKTDVDEANAHVNDTSTNVHPQYVMDADLAAYATTASVNTAIIHDVGHTFVISGDVVVPSGDLDFVVPFFVPIHSGRVAKLVRARHKINAGTSATVKLQKNGVDITGFTGISVTTTATDTDPADVTLANNDLIALIVTAVSGSPKNLTFTCVLELS